MPGQTVVGFAAEHGDGALDYARGKLARKGLDAIVVNDVSRPGIGFDTADNEVTIVAPDGERPLARAPKGVIAAAILDEVVRLRATTSADGATGPASPIAPHECEAAAGTARRIVENVRAAVQVQSRTLEHVIVALLAEGHVLMEDYPGVGKTALARALSRSLDCQFARIQCTADLLPADVVGSNIYNQREARFEFRPGPVFANVVLVDEINRASPHTQSGLLECMQERRVTVDVHTHELARPFLVLATQNPAEYEGTYPLPEAQVDRFMVRVSLGYPDLNHEVTMLGDHSSGDRVQTLQPVVSAAEVLAAQDTAARVQASQPLREYLVARAAAARATTSASSSAPARAPA